MKYLIVANQTLGGEALTETVRFRSLEGASFHVVVPATPPHDQHHAAEGDAVAIAERRLGEALERFKGLGAKVTGEVGDENPLHAIETAVAADRYGGIIISTLPSGASRWLKMDLPHRAERHTDLPVQWIEAADEPVVDLTASEAKQKAAD